MNYDATFEDCKRDLDYYERTDPAFTGHVMNIVEDWLKRLRAAHEEAIEGILKGIDRIVEDL